jgi:predicted regulator of Ras-like GTPase activity (Roadblock/LC7/MglB family)
MVPIADLIAVSSESAPLESDAYAFASQFAIVFYKSAEAASKLSFGETKTNIAFYDDFILVQSSMAPVILTIVTTAEANIGMVLHLLPQLHRVLEPVRLKAESEAPQ